MTTVRAVWVKHRGISTSHVPACLLDVDTYHDLNGIDWSPNNATYRAHWDYYEPIAVPEPKLRCTNCLAAGFDLALAGKLTIVKVLPPYQARMAGVLESVPLPMEVGL